MGKYHFCKSSANDLRSFRFCLPLWISSWAFYGVFGAAVFESISGRLLQKQYFNSRDLVTRPYGFIKVSSQLNNSLHTSSLETPLYHCMQVFVMFGTIWYHLNNLKIVKNIHGGVLLLACNFTKSNTPPWVFSTFLKLFKWYQIAQRITLLSCSKLLYEYCTKYGIRLELN